MTVRDDLPGCRQHKQNVTHFNTLQLVNASIGVQKQGNHFLLLLLLLLHLFNSLCSRTTWVSRYQKGKTSLDLNEARDDGVMGWQWHQLDHRQTICTLLQTDNHTNTSSLNFYRSDALPDAQPTVSKHCSKPVHRTENKTIVIILACSCE